MFPKQYHMPRILSVLKLKWGYRDMYARPRPFHALSMRLDGSSTFIHKDQRFQVNKDDILFMPKGYDYIQQTNTGENLFCIHFAMNTDVPLQPTVFVPTNPTIFRQCFSSMYDQWKVRSTGFEYAALSLFYSILQNVEIQQYESNRPTNSTLQQLRYVIQYINTHFSDADLSIAQLAAMMHICDSYFREIFQHEMGLSPKEYINSLRKEYACALLQSGYYSVAEVAKRVGIPNTKYFYTFIKKQTGKIPSDLKP